MAMGALALIAALIGAFVILSRQSSTLNETQERSPADSTVVAKVTTVPQPIWNAVGKGRVIPHAFQPYGSQPPLIGPNKRPEFLYIGGEYCPYCAAERWAIVNALSRFGAFRNLSQIRSAELSISTFSFYGSSYTSRYVDSVSKEVKGNELDASQTNYVDLEKLTPLEQKMFQMYDNDENLPFVDIGNLSIGIGASYDYSVLFNNNVIPATPLSWQTIADSLNNPKSAISQGILGTANYMTAGICSLTHQQPGNVCNSPAIQQIEQTMETTFKNVGPLAPIQKPLAGEGQVDDGSILFVQIQRTLLLLTKKDCDILCNKTFGALCIIRHPLRKREETLPGWSFSA